MVSKVNSGALVLESGQVFNGQFVGEFDFDKPFSGEIVFNTSMSGYQEIISDPSYAGQIVNFTYPHIGNYGISDLDDQSDSPHLRGIVVKELSRVSSNWRSQLSIQQYLEQHNIGALTSIDTRKLTRLIREKGSLIAAFGPTSGPKSFTIDELESACKDEPGTDGVDLVSQVTTPEAYIVGDGPKKIVALDFGVKRSILDQLAKFATITVVPASTSAEEILSQNPDGVFLSNGPGDPRVVTYAVETVKELISKVPIFGICLGHQILSLAIGGEITKLRFGHHGANHPVGKTSNGQVEITSQNHNFALDPATVSDVAEVTDINLNDGVCQGIRLKNGSAFSVQHHPEASPGPHDSNKIFYEFKDLMENFNG